MKPIVVAYAIGLCAISSATGATAGKLEPREAGARYGQALGATLVCDGLRTTDAVPLLPATYADKDRQAFDREADKVLTAWREASICHAAGGPNPCRLAHIWSCRDALREIGPDGTKLPGLIQQKTD